jgi:voltage-gated potassium channel
MPMLQSSAGSTILLFAYYQAPLDRPLDATTGRLSVLALLLFSAVTWFQLRGILQVGAAEVCERSVR